MITIIRLLIITLAVLSFTTHASDLAKEKRWADQVVDAILDGDAVWLNDGTSEFLGIYTEAEEDKSRAVIVMHGTGIHPDWQQVIQPLRVGLSEHNWNTLSIQMPILPNEAEYPEYAPLYDEVAPRINAAIKYLQDNDFKIFVTVQIKHRHIDLFQCLNTVHARIICKACHANGDKTANVLLWC